MVIKKYKTPKNAPQCVQYWDAQFQSMELWFDWLIVKAVVEESIPMIRKESGCSKKEALDLAWSAYCAAICGHQDSPMRDALLVFLSEISPAEKPLYVAYSAIGTDIHRGIPEDIAKSNFVQWLEDTPQNGRFGDYLLTADLKVFIHKNNQIKNVIMDIRR